MTMECRGIHSGKVRELYDAGDGRLLMVASDRVSAFEPWSWASPHRQGPGADGHDELWCDEMADIVRVPDHGRPGGLADALGGCPAALPTGPAAPSWCDRPKCSISSACVRGVPGRPGLRGSTRGRHGARAPSMPAGLQLASQLEEPILHPLDQGGRGPRHHIDFAGAVDRVGAERALAAKQTRWPCTAGPQPAAPRAGFVLADTSSSWGTSTGALLCDEVCRRLLTAVAATRSCPVRRHPPSTSSRCATGWPRSPGTASAPPAAAR